MFVNLLTLCSLTAGVLQDELLPSDDRDRSPTGETPRGSEDPVDQEEEEEEATPEHKESDPDLHLCPQAR